MVGLMLVQWCKCYVYTHERFFLHKVTNLQLSLFNYMFMKLARTDDARSQRKEF
jgi:hypothetical protein